MALWVDRGENPIIIKRDLSPNELGTLFEFPLVHAMELLKSIKWEVARSFSRVMMESRNDKHWTFTVVAPFSG